MSTISLLALFALVCVVCAVDVTVTTPSTSLNAGSSVTLTIQYSPNTGSVPAGTNGNLVLMRGNNGDFSNGIKVSDLASDVKPNVGSVTVTLPANLVEGSDYFLKWEWQGQPMSTYKYSATFPIKSNVAPTATLSSTQSTSSTSISSTTSSTSTPTSMSTSTSVAATTRPTLSTGANTNTSDSNGFSFGWMFVVSTVVALVGLSVMGFTV